MKLLLCLPLVATKLAIGANTVSYRRTKVFTSIRMSSNVESDRNIHFSNPRWEGAVTYRRTYRNTFCHSKHQDNPQIIQHCGTAELIAVNFLILVNKSLGFDNSPDYFHHEWSHPKPASFKLYCYAEKQN